MGNYSLLSSSLAFMTIPLLMGIMNATALPDSGAPNENLDTSSGNLSISGSNDLGNVISTDESKYVLPLTTIIGFLPKLYQVYKTIDTLLNPEEPKKTLEDVMNRVTQEFSEVKNQLKVIEKKLIQQEIYVYRDVEAAVVVSLNALKHQSSIDIQSGANTLYNQLNLFLNGMLGHSITNPDLLVTLRELHEVSQNV